MGSGTSIAIGAFIGTGSAMSIEKIGFKPRFLFLANVDDPGFAFCIEGMPAAHALIHTDGTTSYITSTGITLTDKGFDLGTRADLNTDGEQVFYAAIE